MRSKLSSQRLFQNVGGNYIFLTKGGRAVFFQVDEQKRVHIRETLEDVDFKATGTGLKREGWRCVGPAIECDWVLGAKKGSIRSAPDWPFHNS
ncbi:MAG: hypothetical protein KAV83_09065 [Desulfobacterales bacterium]|nr:hypothetical protein [Desulfobacterales bacterium]